MDDNLEFGKMQWAEISSTSDLVCKLNWLFTVIVSFLTKLAIKVHTNPYIFATKVQSVLLVSLSVRCNNHEISSLGRLF